MYNILFAVGAISFDWILRLCLMFYQNIRLRKGKTCNGTKTIGHRMELQAVGSEITVITIQDVHLSWKSGQHLYLYVPYLGLLESHPFTIATSYKVAGKCQCSEIQLAVRAQKGISRRLHRYAAKTQGISNHCLTCFIAGPYGVPPRWEAYETLILISASTGASFALPVLESILNDTRSICTRRIRFLLVVRERSHVDYYVTRLDHALARAEALGIVLDVEIAVTGDERPLGDETSVDMVLETQQELSEKDVEDPKEGRSQQSHVLVKSITASKSSTSRQRPSDAARCCCNAEDKSSASSQRIAYSSGRPEVAKCIRDAVELTGGETAVAVCAGKSLVATVRNTVFELSDDRGVHKGTGAQGIFLHVEEYCF
jgi:NAD(P)H-flavin reductase